MIKVNLSRLMGEKRLNIADVAKMTGLHRNGITRFYHDRSNGIQFDTLEKLCKALDCRIEDLLEIIVEVDNEDKQKDR
jgi:putative transcriptional regulator